MSPGTVASMAWRVCGPEMEMELTVRSRVAPKARRASSLWSRGADGFADGGGAGGLEAGKEDAGFDLGAGDRGGVVDGLELAAANGKWGVAIGKGEVSAHEFQGRLNALHGAAGEGWVADQGEFRGVVRQLGREQAGDHAHG